jgi:hypothetical protein
MTITSIRLFQLLLIPCVLVTEHYYLLYYNAIMYLSLEFLNSQKDYTEQTRYKFYNLLFIGFQLLFSFDRLRPYAYKLNLWWEWQMNSVEHIIFAFIICFKIVQYQNLRFLKVSSLFKRIVITFISFNVIGLLGEIFQLSLNVHSRLVLWHGSFDFLEDNIKDMKMNLIGSSLFCAYMFYESRIITNNKYRLICL